MADDMELVREFATGRSDAAFETLVSRHLNLVYSVALRQVRNPYLAQEVTQAVFVILARKAGSLGSKTILSGWLFRTAQYASADALKIQRRRQHREQEAYMQSILNCGCDAPSQPTNEEAWTQIAPLLDAAMLRLGEKDRNAIVLRYFENKNLHEVGVALGASEDSARVRINRALEKLRKFFTKRSVMLSATVISTTVSANSVQAAPVGLAATVTTVAKGAAVATSITAIVNGTMKLMTWMKFKFTVYVGATAIVAGGVITLALANRSIEEQSPQPNGSIPPFIAEGFISCEFHRNPLDTNRVIKSDGKVLFSYSNGIWQIQFSYQHYYNPGLSVADGRMATMIDDKRIPDGIREIFSFPSDTNTVTADGRPISKTAIVRLGSFPSVAQQEVFLPWLCLCPNPELPLVNSRLIHINFMPELFDNPKNAGGFKATYIGPEQQFLSELTITNNGTIFSSDGNTYEYPEPYKKGYVEFSYKVLETTNCNGINFPLNAVLCQFAPLPNGISQDDVYLGGIIKFHILRIDVGGHNLTLKPVPASVLALDYRLGLANNRTMNYMVTNDLYLSLTNRIMQQLANVYERMATNKPRVLPKPRPK